MKPATLFAIILFGLATALTAPARAQNPVSASVSQSGKVSFRIRQEDFTIYLSDAGQLLDYYINGKGRIDYDLNGRLRSIGSVGIEYDLNDRIRRIGSSAISYDLSDRIREVGSLRIRYNLNDQITEIGNTRISYDLNGRVSNIDG
ncbi:hypothetical protein Q5H92_06830 [Hymenobacter sp. M29]|uniref:Uncharacterized protein n=1 Tax=Hymenobacter mellowenesis TaxID=3063995 RepID=A0ABT9A9H2_9BACT|nr:hypothetical protein [Hymenobacter sp. M29]MDO7846062.1 hypothetical protein [Hymenobacter sp. M29]